MLKIRPIFRGKYSTFQHMQFAISLSPHISSYCTAHDYMHCAFTHSNAVFSPRIIQGMMGGHGLGVVYGHIEAFGLFPLPHQRKLCAEGLQGRHALSMLGRTLQCLEICNEQAFCST